MRTHYDPGLKATVTSDDAGRIRGINHLDEYREMNLRGRGAAEAYVRDIAGNLNVAPQVLRNLDQPVSYRDPRQQEMEYRFSQEKASFDLTTYFYCQTYLNTPVWEAGVTVTLKQAPARASARVVGATDTSEHGIDAKLPSPEALERYRRLLATGEKIDDRSRPRTSRPPKSKVVRSDLLTDILGSAARVATRVDDAAISAGFISGQFFIYRYDAKTRTDPEAPTLPLPPVPSTIQDGNWCFVAELVFQLPHDGIRMNWRMLIDVETNTVLYLRAISSGLVTGKVFPYDPVTSTGRASNTAARSNAVLNRLRKNEKLHNLNRPTGKPRIQSLKGRWAELTNLTSPPIDPPTRPAGRNFDIWDVRTNQFAAVNAYYHVDRFFRLVEDLGFPMTGPNAYFGDTNFPVQVDHRAFKAPWPDGNVINATVVGLGGRKGIDAVYFALADISDGFVDKVTVNNGGSHYTKPPKVELISPVGTGAKAIVKRKHIVGGAITAVTVVKRGKGYKVGPLVRFDGGGGTGAFATAQIDISDPLGIATDWRVTLHELGGHGTLLSQVGKPQFGFAHSAGDSFAMILNDYASEWHNKKIPDHRFLLFSFVTGLAQRRSDRKVDMTDQSVANVIVLKGGRGYLTVTLTGGGVAAAKVRPQDIVGGAVTQVTITDAGRGYTSAPQVIFEGGGGTDADAIALIDPSGSVTAVTMNRPGSGYTSPPKVRFEGGGIVEARAGIRGDHIIDGTVTRVTVTDPGIGYTTAPSVRISGGGGTGATATAQIDRHGSVTGFTVCSGGSDYEPVVVEFSGDGEAIAFVGPADIVDGAVTKITMSAPGQGYTRAPRVRVRGGGGRGVKAIAEIGTWGWGGGMDTGTDGKPGSGYFSEQILSSTMFRAYQSIGGDATSISRREFAARAMTFLMLQAIHLCSLANPKSPAGFLEALRSADTSDWASEGMSGGAYYKVLTWAFEKQNLYNGNPPSVDVYINDGRAGEYQYAPVYWATSTIWNRRNPDGLSGHQEPALGQTNHAYVKIKNRGTSIANDVIVKGYHCKPSAGLRWPNDLQPLTTPQIAVGTLQPNNAEEKTVGPFAWTPLENGWGHDCMLMIVSAHGDKSNVANLDPGEVIEDWRLVPNDNNIAQRNVVLAPGGGGPKALKAALHGKGLWVRNPGPRPATIAVAVALPSLLARRGWRIGLPGLAARGARLKPGEERLVTYVVHPGTNFTKANVAAATDRDIAVTVTANGATIGGMIYRIDPTLVMPFNERGP